MSGLMEKGMEQMMLKNIRNLMDSLQYTAEQAMDLLKVSEEERIGLRPQL